MNVSSINEDFKRAVSGQIELNPQGDNRIVVNTPFRFSDGDHFVIALRREDDGWVLTDEANTVMHLSYCMDIDALEDEGNRKELFDNSLSLFSVENRGGELVKRVAGDKFGDALFNFVQALMKVSDVSYLTRERVRSTFMEDLFAFLRKTIPPERITFNWKADRDEQGKYPVDARINKMKRPLFLYGIPHEEKMKDVTINLLVFDKWKLKFQSVAVFEDLQAMSKKPLAKFLDVNDKPFSSFDEENKERLSEYLHDLIEET
ncbi:MAG: DUF1828 domain-containing protein [Candidatus Sulfotelmatobacter sp.]